MGLHRGLRLCRAMHSVAGAVGSPWRPRRSIEQRRRRYARPPAATLAAAAGALWAWSEGKMAWDRQAPLLMVIPILYLIASRLYRGHPEEQPLGWVAHAGTAVMLLASVAAATLAKDPGEHH